MIDNITPQSVRVTWKAAKAKTATEKLQYRVEHDGGAQKRVWQEVHDSIKELDSETYACTITSLEAGVTYRTRIIVINSFGDETPSKVTSVTTIGSPAQPDSPSIFIDKTIYSDNCCRCYIFTTR
jgi:hypothetical protein